MSLKRKNSDGTWTTISGRLPLADNLTTESASTALTAKQGKVLKDLVDGVFDSIYPVGSIYVSINNTLPASISAHGTWEKLAEGKCLWNTASGGGTDITQALPNITGAISANYMDANAQLPAINGGSGAFTGGSTGSGKFNNQTLSIATISWNPGLFFNAHNSNAVYQDGANVQPPAIAVCMWKRTA